MRLLDNPVALERSQTAPAIGPARRAAAALEYGAHQSIRMKHKSGKPR
jgi:hypothetical protein